MKVVNESVERKTQNDKGGWSLKVGDEWVSCGFKEPQCNEGDTVSFETYLAKGKYPTLQEGTLEVTPSSSPVAQANTQRQDNKQDSIIYQSSLKVAAHLVAAQLQQGTLPLPTKKSDQSDAVMEYFYTLTDELAWKAKTASIEDPDVASGVSLDGGDDSYGG